MKGYQDLNRKNSQNTSTSKPQAFGSDRVTDDHNLKQIFSAGPWQSTLFFCAIHNTELRKANGNPPRLEASYHFPKQFIRQFRPLMSNDCTKHRGYVSASLWFVKFGREKTTHKGNTLHSHLPQSMLQARTPVKRCPCIYGR